MTRTRIRQVLLSAAAAVLVAGLAIGLAAATGRSRSHASGSPPTRPPSSTAPSPHSVDLAQLTRRAPCPPAVNAARATRAQLHAFHAVALVNCVEQERTYPDGEWTVLVREASESAVDEVVAALDQPDAPRTTDACAAILVATPPLVLVDAAGQYLVPRFPLDMCGHPQASLADRPSWHVISTRKVQQQRTRAEITHHCQAAWKNEVYVNEQAGEQASAGGATLTTAGDQRLDVCIYHTSATDPSVGRYLRGLTLTGGGASELRQALGGAGAARACGPQRQFAVVSIPAGAEVNVELGGCWRVQRDDSARETMGTAQPQIIRRLLGLR